MPLIRNIQRDDLYYIGVWEMLEDDDFFEKKLQLDDEEMQKLQKVHPNRKREWLASRHLLHVLSGRKKRAKCLKDQNGKPYLEGSNLNISISHSGQYAAVIASPYRVGIDIQRKSEKIERIYTKFVGEKELAFLEMYNAVELMHILWGVKEAMFKAWGHGGLDFRRHLFLTKMDWDGMFGKGESWLKKENIHIQYDVQCMFENQYFLVYVFEKVRIVH